jgi:hypothetical protein
MAKKEVVASVIETAGLDQRLQAIFTALTAEEQAEVSIMSADDRVQALELISSLAASATIGGDMTFRDAKPEQDNTVILSPGGMGLRPGTTFRAYLLGTVHIFSKTIKENWKEFKGNTQTFYYNSNYKFRDMNGKEFGIWASPTLRILEKIPTHASLPSIVKADPLVEIHYVGKIEGKDLLKQEYGIELIKGNAAHVFKVKVADGVQYNPYIKGCVNSLNSPFPIESDSGNPVSREEATRANYERLMALQANGNDVAGLLAQ